VLLLLGRLFSLSFRLSSLRLLLYLSLLLFSLWLLSIVCIRLFGGVLSILFLGLPSFVVLRVLALLWLN